MRVAQLCECTKNYWVIYICIYILFLFLFFIFREGKGGRKRKRIDVWLPLTCPLLGTWPTTQACALTRNPTSDPLVCRPALSPLSHTSQGWIIYTLKVNCMLCELYVKPLPKTNTCSKKTPNKRASGQDGTIGKHGSPLLTTTSKLQLKYRTTITQNHQK